MTTQAAMYAGAVSAVAVGPLDGAGQIVSRQVSREVLRRLSATTTDVRARLFAPSGHLVADSNRLRRVSRAEITVEELPTLTPQAQPLEFTRDLLKDLAQLVVPEPHLPLYRDPPNADARAFAEARYALGGYGHAVIRVDTDGVRVLSVAVPVQRFKRVLGAVMLTKRADEIEDAMKAVRFDVLKVSTFALAVTVMLSLYLSGAIARPLRRLAQAAERVRGARNQRHAIPDLTERGDEIGDLSGVLREMTDALWARMDAIERFAADVAHEIKNPLTSLRSAVETATRLKDPERQRQLMGIIAEDVKRLDRLISDISDYSRMDAEMSRADMEPVDLKVMLETLAEVHMMSAPEGLTITVDAPDALTVAGVEGRLAQVFQNLIGNAMTFSPENGTIHAKARQDKGVVIITVEDEGPGIPPGKEEKIFERFYSERPQGEAFGQHSGLGLAISRQIITALGGKLVAENRQDTDGTVLGARFQVTLPLQP
jgi:two-component system sensor histidine kinase ChvG